MLRRYLYKGMARHNASNLTTPGISAQVTGVSTVSGQTGREFGVAPSRGDGGGMSVLLSWHEKVGSSPAFTRSNMLIGNRSWMSLAPAPSSEL